MAKFFSTDPVIVDMIESVYHETSLPVFGVRLKIMSLTKSKDILKVTKVSAATEFLIKSDGTIQLFVYEDAFVRLNEEAQMKLIEGVLSNVSFDTEKDKILIDNTKYGEVLRMRKKYPDYLDIIESGELLLNQIEEEEKEKKQQEKEAKKKNN